MPNPCRTLSSTQVRGMICIRPRAPLGDMARSSPPLSTCMTARIQCAGIANRRDASAIKIARDWLRDALEGRGPGTANSTPGKASDGSTIVRRAPERYAATRRSRKPAIVLTAVQGKAQLAPASRPPWTAAARDGRRTGRDGGMVLRSIEQRNDRFFGKDDHDHSSLVHTGSALPMTDECGTRPK